MSETYQRLAHSSWDCKYHVVFVPKARQKECQIIEGHLLPDHVHMCIAIPPKYPVASVIGFLKGKSAIAMARLCWQRAEFHGRALLGPWIRSVHGGFRVGASSQIHPRTRGRGW